ncbi:MAG: Hsp20/alpha crystallin family protein [Campylobacterales bacterium]|nr:Hsp20/alpha crystallin family protein [Campylobacterales bacterium]
MLLTRFDPFREFEKRFGGYTPSADIKEASNVSSFSPAVNTREDDKAYYIHADLPGVAKEDIHIDLKENVLSISGERKHKEEIKEKDYYKLESFYGKFQRSFTLPENVNIEAIEASNENGVLNIMIPKAAPKESKKIQIK